MISVQYLIDRLNAPVTMSMFATKTDLYMDILEQRKEAASILYQQEERIAELTRERDEALSVIEGVDVLGKKIVAHHEARVKVLEEALEKISSPTQTDGLLWWQIEARSTLKSEGEI